MTMSKIALKWRPEKEKSSFIFFRESCKDVDKANTFRVVGFWRVVSIWKLRIWDFFPLLEVKTIWILIFFNRQFLFLS